MKIHSQPSPTIDDCIQYLRDRMPDLDAAETTQSYWICQVQLEEIAKLLEYVEGLVKQNRNVYTEYELQALPVVYMREGTII